MQRVPCAVEPSDQPFVFDIQVELSGNGHRAFCEISGFHTNVIRLERDGEVLVDQAYTEQDIQYGTDRSLLNVENIVEFADCVALELSLIHI